MIRYYLRTEGVNLSNFVYDTQDLSTVRGGGLLLLEAVSFVEEKLKKLSVDKNVVAITTGASSGLFEFVPKDGMTGDGVRDEIEKELKSDKQYKHATFVVDVIEAGNDGDFKKKKEELMAMNRWRQMQSPSLAVPKHWSNSKQSCETDLVRPSPPGYKTSTSVWKRSQFGREEKRGNLYVKLTGLPEENARFTNDLNELSEDGNRGNLNHKIAVIYADGNSFGKFQSGFDKQTLQRFDAYIKEKRKLFLTALIAEMDKDEKGWKNNEKYRIETLLWGGDEFMLVVPAWKGWETLQLFYKESAKWDFTYVDSNQQEITKPLTHSAGLVFCHHNAPIHRIKDLAHDLAEICKTKSVIIDKGNYFAYQALESFDHITGDLKEYLEKMSVNGKAREMVLAGSDMGTIVNNIATLKADADFARGRLHGIVKQLRKKVDAGAASEIITAAKKDIKDEIEKVEKAIQQDSISALEALKVLLNDENRWLHIADLWDYIPEKKEVEDNA